MAEDLSSNIQTYAAQLQQVEAALTNDPDNEELLKLKTDLKEVLQLTEDLLEAKPSTVDSAEEESSINRPVWHVGSTCQAVYSEDGLYYHAVIDEIHSDGTVTVTFDSYGNTETVQISTLKAEDSSHGTKRTASEAHLPDTDHPKSKKELIAAQREYKRKKAAKKAQRVKELETQREEEKSKWQDFNSKASNKTKRGIVKKSIFASPESVSGRVGVGTCGTGGRPMTQFEQPKHVVVRK
ncbi:survival of motor neuron-related-splicing factor 30-like [Glandiceps talaboti]